MTVGIDCDIELIHPQVNGGLPYGFLVEPRSRTFGPLVSVHYEAYQNPDGSIRNTRSVTFNVLLADGLENPDGARHVQGAAQMYAMLQSYCLYHADISVVFANGIITGLNPLGSYVMVENAAAHITSVTVQLTTSEQAFPTAPYDVYLDSTWVDEGAYSGSRNWDNSYWRT